MGDENGISSNKTVTPISLLFVALCILMVFLYSDVIRTPEDVPIRCAPVAITYSAVSLLFFSQRIRKRKGIGYPKKISGASIESTTFIRRLIFFIFKTSQKRNGIGYPKQDIWSKHKNLTEHSSAIFYFSTNLKVNFQFISK